MRSPRPTSPSKGGSCRFPAFWNFTPLYRRSSVNRPAHDAGRLMDSPRRRAARVDPDGRLFIVALRNGAVGNGFRPLHSIMTIDIPELSAFPPNLDWTTEGSPSYPDLLRHLDAAAERRNQCTIYSGGAWSRPSGRRTSQRLPQPRRRRGTRWRWEESLLRNFRVEIPRMYQKTNTKTEPLCIPALRTRTWSASGDAELAG